MVVFEKRLVGRRRCLKIAQILTDEDSSPVDCLVVELSVSGARLKLDRRTDLPTAFELLLVREGIKVLAEVVWRDGAEVGVRFVCRGSNGMASSAGGPAG